MTALRQHEAIWHSGFFQLDCFVFVYILFTLFLKKEPLFLLPDVGFVGFQAFLVGWGFD